MRSRLGSSSAPTRGTFSISGGNLSKLLTPDDAVTGAERKQHFGDGGDQGDDAARGRLRGEAPPE